MKLNNLLIICALALSFSATAQTSPERGDFMFPVRPRQENYLSGTMGELRSTHFHTGLDIKTSGITGLPIYATANGYIQRIRVSLNGYGNALYMVHPETGLVSVYAHLKSFNDEIAEYVREKQYADESFEVNLFPKKDEFLFEQGDVIALSGNSGSSSGPHLHFEIRTAQHRALDPLEYGFDEIIDNIPPVLSKMAFVTLDEKSRVNGMYGRFEFDVLLDENGAPFISQGLSLYGNIGVEIYAFDKFNGARNKNGIRHQTMLYDGKTVFDQNINQLNFSLQRNILMHTNYKRSKEGGRRFNKLYVESGNLLEFYEIDNNNGILKVFDPLEHELEIRLKDAYGNVSQINIPFNDKAFDKNRSFKDTYALDHDGFDVVGNLLEIESLEEGCEPLLYVNGEEIKLQADYVTQSSSNFIWKLKDGLPDSALVCGRTLSFYFNQLIPSDQKTNWQGEGASVSFPKHSLFDSLYLRYNKTTDANNHEIFEFDNLCSPLRQFATVSLKPEGVYDMMKAGIYAISKKGKLSYVGGEWEGADMVFKTRDLVSYTIATDSIPPVIMKKVSRKGRVKFKIEDKMSGIQTFRAELNGKWLLMNFDAKSGYIWSDELTYVRGSFYLAVKDYAGNVSRFEYEF